jgi:hypothetical protein
MSFFAKNKKLLLYPALTIILAAFVLLIISERGHFSPFSYRLF